MSQSDHRVQRRILLIDDDAALLHALATGLALLGAYDILSAADGDTGLQRLISDQPDCVVVDVRMPGLNGYQFVRAVRGDPATVHMPLVVLSALVQEPEQLAGLLSGADAYLLKPVKLAELVAAIERAIAISPDERAQRMSLLFDSENDPIT